MAMKRTKFVMMAMTILMDMTQMMIAMMIAMMMKIPQVTTTIRLKVTTARTTLNVTIVAFNIAPTKKTKSKVKILTFAIFLNMCISKIPQPRTPSIDKGAYFSRVLRITTNTRVRDNREDFTNFPLLRRRSGLEQLL